MKRFAVIGLGRFGKKLAIALAMSGAEVIAIDKERGEIELSFNEYMRLAATIVTIAVLRRGDLVKEQEGGK